MGYLWLFSIAMFVHWMITTIYVRPMAPESPTFVSSSSSSGRSLGKSKNPPGKGWVHLVTLTISTKNSLYSEAMAMTLTKIRLVW